MATAEQLRNFAAKHSGATIEQLARWVFEKDQLVTDDTKLFPESDFSGAKMAVVKKAFRDALRAENAETGLDYFYAVRDPEHPKSEDKAKYYQPELLSFDDCVVVASDLLHNVVNCLGKADRFLDFVEEQHGIRPPSPMLIWPK